MNDDELRAFLESATVGEDNADGSGADDNAADGVPSATEAEQPTVVLPPAPASAEDRVPSFDELIGSGSDPSADAELPPIVLPGPPSAGRRSPFGEPDAVQAPPAPSRAPEPEQAAPIPAPKPAAPKPAAQKPAAPKPAVPARSAEEKPTTPAWGAPTAAAAATGAAAGAAAARTPDPAAAARPPQQPSPTPAAPAAPTAPMAPISAASAASTQIGPPTAALPEVDGDYEKISVTGGERRTSRFVPWIIVAVGAIVAVVVAIFIVTSLSGGGNPEPAPTAAPTTESPTSSQPSTPSDSDDDGEQGGSTQPTRAPATTAPQVEVGPTMNLPVADWGVQADLSERLGLSVNYRLDGQNLVLSSSLIDSLPASCSKEWGMTRTAAGDFEVLKPAERCAAAPAVYDELWGLMDAMVKSVRPL